MRLNLTEAAKRLDISRATLKKIIDAGKIPAYVDDINGRPVVDEADLASYAKSRFTPYTPTSQELKTSEPSSA